MTQLATKTRDAVPAADWPIAAELRPLCVRALRRMYDRETRLFCWCIRRGAAGDLPEGISHRYTAIVLIGLAAQQEDLFTPILGAGGEEHCFQRLLADVPQMTNLGDVALIYWAAAARRRADAAVALNRLRELDPVNLPNPTVEVSWALTSLSIGSDSVGDAALAKAIARRLMAAFHPDAGLFPHWLGEAPEPWRSHVTCFADWVYPVQALSHHFSVSANTEAIEIAQHSADAMCALQGPGGQWWWHYDIRTGRVLEPYPVYSVHQEAMAPMALFAVEDACGVVHHEAVQRGLEWMLRSPERGDSLVDHEADLIWRKVCRREPGKLVRGIQASLSRMQPDLRLPGANLLFPPRAVDYECRPYHLGWLLYAFHDRRVRSPHANAQTSSSTS